MKYPINFVQRQVRLGRIFLAAGLVLFLAGIVLQRLVVELPFDPRIISGLGILLLGVALSSFIRYGWARRNPQAAARLVSEERDERIQLIRGRAGSRAYWLSAALAYAGLMWLSFASNGSLPALSADALWYFLAGLVILPFGVYAASILYDEKNM